MFSQIPWSKGTKRRECIVWVIRGFGILFCISEWAHPTSPPSIPDWHRGLFYRHALGKEMDLDLLFSPKQDRKGGKGHLLLLKCMPGWISPSLQLTMIPSEGCLLSKTCFWQVQTLSERSSGCEVWRAWLCLSLGAVLGTSGAGFDTDSSAQGGLSDGFGLEKGTIIYLHH